ncbi:MAG: cytochrome c oxidase assembly factor Coa1 family protein [Treponemataceae bacterium]|nr:cytochrome c oxidase assembly factor Coa1 family protein [Treponemataceae bacterium]
MNLVIFLILWITPIVAGIIVAKRKNRSPHWFWFGLWPGAGGIVFVIMLILKPLEICSNCGKKIPRESIVCPFCGKETLLSSATEEEKKALKKRQNKKTLITALIVVLIFAVLLTFVFLSVKQAFKTCEPYKHSIELIENNSEIMDYIGSNYKQTGMMAGSISTNSNLTGKAAISYKIKGANGVSRVYVEAEKENGVWKYKEINFYKVSNTPEVIDLLNE